jgi:hypothetical protein
MLRKYTVWYRFHNDDGSETQCHTDIMGVDVLTALEEFQRVTTGKFRNPPTVDAIRRA